MIAKVGKPDDDLYLCPFNKFKECYRHICMAWEPEPRWTEDSDLDDETSRHFPTMIENPRGGDCRLLKSKRGSILAAMFGRKEDD